MVLSASSVESLDDRPARRSRSSSSRRCSRVIGAAAAGRRLAAAGAGLASASACPMLAVGDRAAAARAHARSGVEVNGNRTGSRVGRFSVQPSEAAKLALVLVGGADPGRASASCCTQWQHVLVPARAGRRRSCSALVLLGHDLGTALILIADRRRRCCSSPGPRCGCSPSPAAAVRRAGRRAHGHQRQPAGPDRRLARPATADPLGAVLPGDARHVRAGRRRLVGRRARGEPGEVGAACPRRTTTSSSRSSARSSGCSARSWCSALFGLLALRLLPRWSPRTDDPFVRLAAAGDHGLDHRPGAGQHRRGHRPAAGHRRPAAAGLLRRSALVTTMFGARHAALLRPRRAGRAEALARAAVVAAPLARGDPGRSPSRRTRA